LFIRYLKLLKAGFIAFYSLNV